MIGTKTEEMGSRKKLLAPVVVLLLCAVSLTGAAYAYSSTYNINGNTIDAEEFVLQVYQNDNTSLVSEPFNIKGVDLYTGTTIGAGDDAVVVNAATIATANTYIGMITLKNTDLANGTKLTGLTVTPTLTNGTIAASALTASGATEGTITLTVTAGLYTTAAANVEVIQNAETGNVTFTDGVATLYYKVTVEGTGSITFGNGTPQADVTAVQGKIDLASFILAFSAADPATGA